MFRYENSMRICDTEKYPYSLEYVKESRYENYHGKCDENGFCIMAAGSKHLFCTPELSEFSLKMNVSINAAVSPFKVLRFGVMFGYSKAERSGYEIEFTYGGDSLEVALVKFVCSEKTKINETKFDNVHIGGTTKLLKLYVTKDGCRGCLGKYGFDFKTKMPCGKIGIDVSSVYAGITFADAYITSKESFKKSSTGASASAKVKLFSIRIALP